MELPAWQRVRGKPRRHYRFWARSGNKLPNPWRQEKEEIFLDAEF